MKICASCYRSIYYQASEFYVHVHEPAFPVLSIVIKFAFGSEFFSVGLCDVRYVLHQKIKALRKAVKILRFIAVIAIRMEYF